MARHLDYRKVQRDLYAAYRSGALDGPVKRATPDADNETQPAQKEAR